MELVMPGCYVEMQEEEMTYLEAGGTLKVVFSVSFLRRAYEYSFAGICVVIGGVLGLSSGPLAVVLIGAISGAIGGIVGGTIAANGITKSKTMTVSNAILPTKTITIK